MVNGANAIPRSVRRSSTVSPEKKRMTTDLRAEREETMRRLTRLLNPGEAEDDSNSHFPQKSMLLPKKATAGTKKRSSSTPRSLIETTSAVTLGAKKDEPTKSTNTTCSLTETSPTLSPDFAAISTLSPGGAHSDPLSSRPRLGSKVNCRSIVDENRKLQSQIDAFEQRLSEKKMKKEEAAQAVEGRRKSPRSPRRRGSGNQRHMKRSLNESSKAKSSKKVSHDSQEVHKLKAKMKSWKQKHKAEHAEVLTLRKMLNINQTEILGLQRELMKSLTSLEKIRKGEMEGNDDEVATIQDQISQSAEKIRAISDEATTNGEELRAIEREMEEKQIAMEREIEILQERVEVVARLEKRIDELVDEKRASEEQHSAQRRTWDEERSEMKHEMEAQRRILDEERLEMKHDMEGQRRTWDEERSEMTYQIEVQCRKWDEERSEMTYQMEMLENERDALKTKNDSLQNLVAYLETNLEERVENKSQERKTETPAPVLIQSPNAASAAITQKSDDIKKIVEDSNDQRGVSKSLGSFVKPMPRRGSGDNESSGSTHYSQESLFQSKWKDLMSRMQQEEGTGSVSSMRERKSAGYETPLGHSIHSQVSKANSLPIIPASPRHRQESPTCTYDSRNDSGSSTSTPSDSHLRRPVIMVAPSNTSQENAAHSTSSPQETAATRETSMDASGHSRRSVHSVRSSRSVRDTRSIHSHSSPAIASIAESTNARESVRMPTPPRERSQVKPWDIGSDSSSVGTRTPPHSRESSPVRSLVSSPKPVASEAQSIPRTTTAYGSPPDTPSDTEPELPPIESQLEKLEKQNDESEERFNNIVGRNSELPVEEDEDDDELSYLPDNSERKGRRMSVKEFLSRGGAGNLGSEHGANPPSKAGSAADDQSILSSLASTAWGIDDHLTLLLRQERENRYYQRNEEVWNRSRLDASIAEESSDSFPVYFPSNRGN